MIHCGLTDRVSESKETACCKDHGAQDIKQFSLDTVIEDKGNNLYVGQVNRYSSSLPTLGQPFWMPALAFQFFEVKFSKTYIYTR
jgi:hypothetical protein